MTEEKWTGTHNSIEIQWRCKTDTWAWNEFADSTHTFFLWLVVQADNWSEPIEPMGRGEAENCSTRNLAAEPKEKNHQQQLGSGRLCHRGTDESIFC